MAQVRKAGKLFTLDHHFFIPTRVIAVPVTGKLAALGFELSPALLPIQRIDLFFIGPRVMVDHHVGDRTHIVFAEGANQFLKLRAIPVERFDGTFLVEVAEVEVVVWIVAIRCSSRTLAERRKPERVDTGS